MNYQTPLAKGDARRVRQLPVAVLCVLFALRTVAELAVPSLTGRVVDQAGLLGNDAARVESAIRELEQATGGQMAILTVPTLKNDALESFSLRVAEAWKIGRKGQDNGALLVVVRDSHGIRFEIGYGWEGSINDARAGDIIRGMGPYFRGGRFGDGCVFAVRRVEGFVTGKPVADIPPPPQRRQGNNDGPQGDASVQGVACVICIFIFLIVMVANSYRNRGRTYGSGGFFGGSGGGFSSGGGGFSGGGGSFGGGGASGSW